MIASLVDGIVTWDKFLPRVAKGEFQAVWVTGGYPKPQFDEAAAKNFAGVPLLIVQDCFASPLWDMAHYQLPGGTYPERDGSFVNFNEHLQSFRWAIRSPAGVKVEGQLYWQLIGRVGLYNGRKVMEDVARSIAYFAPAAAGVGPTGIDLKANKLAGHQEPAVAGA